MNGYLNGNEFLPTSHVPKAQHGPLSSSKWQIRILGAIVQPAASFMLASIGDDLRRSSSD
uniref:hypothetical protein n=1 Tax=Octadecabacter antarcticus TaxID=1217908 RepID=UPI0016513FB8|nr:hypothetical protein [Octadecabacter antarcticus]